MSRPWTGSCWAGSREHDHNIRRSVPLYRDSGFHRERLAREARIAAAGLEDMDDAGRHDALPAGLSLEKILARMPGSFVSLQYGPHAADLAEAPAWLKSRSAAPLPATANYETACLVQALDEVITVDTAVAHFAGALGQSVLLVKPAAPEWRWIARDGRTVWYPSMRLLDQRSLA